jgi:hypothetical protein
MSPVGRLSIFLTAIVVGLLLYIRFLVRERDRQKEKLSAACPVLLQVAFSKCRCTDNAIILQDLAEPEKVGTPLEKGYCEVCHARAVLAEEYPGEIEREIRICEFQGLPIPEDLFTALRRFYGRKERSNER